VISERTLREVKIPIDTEAVLWIDEAYLSVGQRAKDNKEENVKLYDMEGKLDLVDTNHETMIE